MTADLQIRPVLEDGIDRKTLAALWTRFMAVNAGRLQRTRQGLSTRQQLVLRLLPLLFHSNHPLFPGYVSASTPAGLCGYEPDAQTLAEAQRLCRSFAYRAGGLRAELPIQGLFLMGSMGTIAQHEQSDLDVWVCHDPKLSAAQLDELRRKCDLLEAWAASQGSEAHFFLVDPARFASGERAAQLTSDDCGTTQHYLLLDEFYRTAIWLGGRVPVWWLVPAYEEHRYEHYVQTMLDRRFLRPEEVLDLGHLARIPPGEFLGAGLWQLCKGIDSPYKSLFKLLLVEVYASEHPRVRCLSLDFKEAVYANRLSLDELDPYIGAYRRIEAYLLARGDQERLELLRHCLYLKINRRLSRPSTSSRKSWQRQLLERLTQAWQWDSRQFLLLDSRNQWKVRQVERERRALVNELTHGYGFLNDFARQLQIASSVNARDFAVLGRRLHAAIDRRAGKVEFLNQGISPDMSEHSLTLVHTQDAERQVSWTLFEGNLGPRDVAAQQPLKRARELVPLLAWCHRNGVIDAATHLCLHPGSSDLSEAELFSLLTDLRTAFPLPLPAVSEDALLVASQPRRILLLVNVGLDPFSAKAPLAGLAGEAVADYATARENLAISIDQVTLNSWNEMLVSRYEGPQALADCLRHYLDSLPANDAERPVLQIHCCCRASGQAIARRLDEIFRDAQDKLDGGPGSRYLLQVRQHFHLLERVPGQVRHTALQDLPALLDYLGEAHHVYRPLHLDRHALAGQDLPLILAQARPDCLQLFYRVQGNRAELSILDEFNALWRRQVPYRDEHSLLAPLLRFLKSMGLRREAQLPIGESRLAPMAIFIHRIVPAQPDRPASLEPREVPTPQGRDPFLDVQAIVEPGETGRTQVTLYCDHQEFSSLEYGNGLFTAVARHILARRRTGERYPCYITDLDLSALHGNGRTQTVQYLRYKTHLEAALNKTLVSL